MGHSMSSVAIILAAGKSTRLKSALPKALHEVCGKPMLQWVLDACYDAGCTKIVVVVGHGKDQIIAAFGHDKRIHWVEQTQQLGTGDAARAAEPILKNEQGNVFILTGDGPLVRGQVLKTVLEAHRHEKADATMATAILDDPTGYGRVIRDDDGQFIEIVEELDCTPQQRALREVFPSVYCLKAADLLLALSKLKNNNKKKEYYLTDIFGILRQQGRSVLAIQAVAAEDILGVNTRQQLAEVDAIMQDRIQQQIQNGGVTITSPVNTYVEADVACGQDTVIHPFSFIGRGAQIGPRCVIGPFAMIPRQSVVPEGSTVNGGASITGTPDRQDSRPAD